MQSSRSVCQTRHPLTAHFKGALLGKNAAHPTAYTHSQEGSSGAEIKMCSQNSLAAHNIALQPAFAHHVHLPCSCEHFCSTK